MAVSDLDAELERGSTTESTKRSVTGAKRAAALQLLLKRVYPRFSALVETRLVDSTGVRIPRGGPIIVFPCGAPIRHTSLKMGDGQAPR